MAYTPEISDLDIEQRIAKLFSFVSLTHNKQMSPVALMLVLVQDESLRTLFSKYTEMTFFDLVRRMAYIYPVLHKSRKLVSVISNKNLYLDTNK
jgi:hypothetical protein